MDEIKEVVGSSAMDDAVVTRRSGEDGVGETFPEPGKAGSWSRVRFC